MSSLVIHKARVISATNNSLTFSLLHSAGSCGGCKLSGICDQHKPTPITVPTTEAHEINVGDIINVGANANARQLATGLLLATPLAALTIGILGSRACGAGDTTSALCGLALTGVALAGIAIANKMGSGRNPIWTYISKADLTP